jgi:hypothetical protein
VYDGAMSLVVHGFQDDQTPVWRLPDILFRLIINPAFEVAVEAIRKEIGIDYDKLCETIRANSHGKITKNDVEKKVFQKLSEFANDPRIRTASIELAEQFDVPKRWIPSLINGIVYVGSIRISDVYDHDGIILHFPLDEETQEPKFLIEINENTTLTEIKKNWPAISQKVRQHAVHSPKARKPWRKKVRDYMIYEYTQQGKSIGEISDLIKKEFEEDLDYGNIKKIESDFRKRMGISKKYRKRKLRMRRLPIEDTQ